MANGYKVRIESISTDGTNLYVTLNINDGAHRLPDITPVFVVGTSAATITAYAQTIATNGPTLTSDIAALVGTTVSG